MTQHELKSALSILEYNGYWARPQILVDLFDNIIGDYINDNYAISEEGFLRSIRYKITNILEIMNDELDEYNILVKMNDAISERINTIEL
jgi:hypothetical protein